MLCWVLNMPLIPFGIFITFFIKLNPIWAYKNPKLQNSFQKRKRSIKTKAIIYSCEELHPKSCRVTRSGIAELISHSITLTLTTSRPAKKTRYPKRIWCAVGRKDSVKDPVVKKVI